MFGQKKTLIQNLFLLGPIFLAATMSILMLMLRTFERASYAVLLIGLVGVIFIAMAKWPALKQGKFMTFGPKDMSAPARKKYFIGYILLAISLVGSAGLLISSQ